MDPFAEVVAWTEYLTTHSPFAPDTIRRYIHDADQFVHWLYANTLDHRLSQVTAGDARDYRDALLAAGRKPATVNRTRTSLDVREPLEDYLIHRRHLAERWQLRQRTLGRPLPPWAAWPEWHLFLGQRGPLRERGMREIVAKLGDAAKLDQPLFSHALRHTFATALLNPQAYGFDRPPAPLTAVQDLLGHADPATTARYTRATHADLARFMGEPGDTWY